MIKDPEKEVRSLVNRIQSNENFKQPAKSVEDNNHPKVVSTMAELFTRLKAITVVGNAFKTQEEEYIVKQEWILAFAQEGIKSQDIIDRGVEVIRVKSRKNRGITWFPSIGEFIDGCMGSDNKLEFAERAYNLFIRREQQIDNVGRMVTASHSFELRQLKAADCKKGFIELYLKYAVDNKIKPLEAFALTDSVTLTPEQEKAAQERADAAKDDFLQKFSYIKTEKQDSIFDRAKDITPKRGVVTGKIKTQTKTPAQLEAEKKRQLEAIKNRMEK